MPRFLGDWKTTSAGILRIRPNLHAPISWGLENISLVVQRTLFAIYMPRFLGDWKTSAGRSRFSEYNLHAPISWGLENLELVVFTL